MNKIILTGNLTRDPKTTRKKDGQEKEMVITRFDLAVSRRQKQEEPDYFHCTSFGRQAEFVEKYFRKGSSMILTGRVQNNNYTTKKGDKVYGFNIITEEVEFGEKKKSSDSGQTGDGREDFVSVPDDAGQPVEGR